MDFMSRVALLALGGRMTIQTLFRIMVPQELAVLAEPGLSVRHLHSAVTRIAEGRLDVTRRTGGLANRFRRLAVLRRPRLLVRVDNRLMALGAGRRFPVSDFLTFRLVAPKTT